MKLNYKGVDYELKPITIGGLIDFQKSKAILSDGMYGVMYRMGLVETDHAIVAIDIQAFLVAFLPDFAKAMKVKVSELGIKDYEELKALYLSDMKPWFDESMKLLNPDK